MPKSDVRLTAPAWRVCADTKCRRYLWQQLDLKAICSAATLACSDADLVIFVEAISSETDSYHCDLILYRPGLLFLSNNCLKARTMQWSSSAFFFCPAAVRKCGMHRPGLGQVAFLTCHRDKTDYRNLGYILQRHGRYQSSLHFISYHNPRLNFTDRYLRSSVKSTLRMRYPC